MKVIFSLCRGNFQDLPEYLESVYMEMIDLVYRFCSSRIFHHIVWCSERTRIHLNLILSSRPHFCAAIVHRVGLCNSHERTAPGVSRGQGSHVPSFTQAGPGAKPAAGPLSQQTHVLGAGSYRRKDTESCRINKSLLKNLKRKRGSVYRVRAGRKTAPSQRIESKDRLVCL